MKNVLARATLRTESFVNTGFIYITDSKIEGIFSLDYLCISLDGKKMIINILEHSPSEDCDFQCDDIVLCTYQCRFPYTELYIPDNYVLQDEHKNTLNLSIESIVYDSERKSRIIDCINQSRCQF